MEILFFRPKSTRNILKQLDFRITGQHILQTKKVKGLPHIKTNQY